MKRVLLFSFIISCAFVNAQLIDTVRFHKDYYHLLDSVNCIYVKTYCEHYVKYGESQSKQNDSIYYVRYIKPRLEKEVLSYDTLSLLLISNGWKATANNILAPLNLNKNNQTKRIEDLLFLGRINDDGIKNILLLEQEKLQREIINRYSLKSNKRDMKTLIIAIVALAISLILCGLFVLNLLKKNKSFNCTNSNREELNNTSRINTLTKRIEQLEKQISNLKVLGDVDTKKTIKEVEVLKKNIKTDINVSVFQQKQSEKPIQNIQQQSDSYIFLKHFSNGYLKENDGPSAIFRGFNINGQEALFEFYGDSAYAIQNKDAILSDVCICSGVSYNAQKVESIKPGKIQLEGNGKWKVIVKTEVQFS